MITDSFDNITEPVFTLKDFYGEKKKMLDTCIIIFSIEIYETVLTTFYAQKSRKSMHQMELFQFINSATKERKLPSIYLQSALQGHLSIVLRQTG